MYNNIVYQLLLIRSINRLHLVNRLDFQFELLLCHHDNDQLSEHMDIFVVKIAAKTVCKIIKKLNPLLISKKKKKKNWITWIAFICTRGWNIRLLLDANKLWEWNKINFISEARRKKKSHKFSSSPNLFEWFIFYF